MSNDIFIFKDGIFRQTEIRSLTVKELLSGPYVLRFMCNGWGKVYLASHNDELMLHLRGTSRVHMPMSWLIDMVHEYVDNLSLDQTVGEMFDMMDYKDKVNPDKVVYEDYDFKKTEPDMDEEPTLDSVIK